MRKKERFQFEALNTGVPARLFSSGDRDSLSYIVSGLLACLRGNEQLSKNILKKLKLPVSKTTQINCYTHMQFKKGKENVVPDGVIQIQNRDKTWTAIVIACAGCKVIDLDIVEHWMEVVENYSFDALITLSNQLSCSPLDHPIVLPKRRIKRCKLYHWSWMWIISELFDCKKTQRKEDFLLEEFIRFLKDPSTGIVVPIRFSSSWKEMAVAIKQDLPLQHLHKAVGETVDDWHRLIEHLAFKLSLLIEHAVDVDLHGSSENHLEHDIRSLLQDHVLEGELQIPNLHSPLHIVADIKKQSIAAKFQMQAPSNKKRASAMITWLLGQVSKCEDDELLVRAVWPGRLADTETTLKKLREDREILLQHDTQYLPTAFELLKQWQIGDRMLTAEHFIEDAETILPDMYIQVIQQLKTWSANSRVQDVPIVEKVANKKRRLLSFVQSTT